MSASAVKLGWILSMAAFPLLMLIAAIVPYVNAFLFSFHGGLGWYLMVICGPTTVARIAYDSFIRRNGRIPACLSCAYLGSYILVTYVLGLVAQSSLEKFAGLDFSHNLVCSAMNLPWSYALNRHPLAM
jgi:hypothetical protein